MNDVKQFLREVEAAKNMLQATIDRDKVWMKTMQEDEKRFISVVENLSKYLKALNAAQQIAGL